jgi:hypothetical protein
VNNVGITNRLTYSLLLALQVDMASTNIGKTPDWVDG